MGFVPKPKTLLRLTFADPDYAGLEILINKGNMAGYLDIAELTGIDAKSGVTKEDLLKIRAGYAAFANSVVSWNVEDDDGNPVPPTVDNLLKQDPDFMNDLMAAWSQAIGGVSRDLKGGSTSGATFPEETIPMSQAPPLGSLVS